MHGLEGYLAISLIGEFARELLDAPCVLKVSFPSSLCLKDASILFCKLQERVV